MKLRIKEIVLGEQRPFSFADFREFEVAGEKYYMKPGTIRNVISQLRKAGQVEPAFRSKPTFYTVPGKKFDKMKTLDHMGVPSAIVDESLLKQTPIFKWIKNRPFNQQALHNIRLIFVHLGIWNIFSKVSPELIEPNSYDIRLQPLAFFGHLNVTITVHHKDTVSVAVSCSSRPVAVDVCGIIRLSEALTRAEVHITNIIDNWHMVNKNDGQPLVSTPIPSYRNWIVKMWHFGIDSIDEYTKDEFNVTFEDGISDLIRIYTKCFENQGNRNKIRVERQEYPNQPVIDTLIRKLFPNGLLVDC